MSRPASIKFDEIGYWTEIKLDIIREYASAYSRILSNQPHLQHIYIEGFAGSGVNVSRRTGGFVRGSPLNALLVKPPFREYHYIDIEKRKTSLLKSLTGSVQNVHIYPGDCNSILLQKVFPLVRYEDFRRGLCVLDPYALHLEWEVIQAAGRLRTIDMFLNFPVMDMNRRVIWRDPTAVKSSDVKRMDDFWGDQSWKQIAYSTTRDLFALRRRKTMRPLPRHSASGCRVSLVSVMFQARYQ